MGSEEAKVYVNLITILEIATEVVFVRPQLTKKIQPKAVHTRTKKINKLKNLRNHLEQ